MKRKGRRKGNAGKERWIERMKREMRKRESEGRREDNKN